MDTLQVVWARYIGAFLLAFAFSNPITRPGVMRTGRPWLQLGRSALLLVSTVLNFFALRYLQLDEAMAIIFSTPFFVAALSGPMLGEWVGWRRWTAIVVGFFGVLLVTRPGFGGIHPAALLAVGAALCYAIYCHHDAHPGAHRQQPDHAVLFQPGRRGGDGAGRAVRLDHAERSADHRPDGPLRPRSAASAITC